MKAFIASGFIESLLSDGFALLANVSGSKGNESGIKRGFLEFFCSRLHEFFKGAHRNYETLIAEKSACFTMQRVEISQKL